MFYPVGSSATFAHNKALKPFASLTASAASGAALAQRYVSRAHALSHWQRIVSID